MLFYAFFVILWLGVLLCSFLCHPDLFYYPVLLNYIIFVLCYVRMRQYLPEFIRNDARPRQLDDKCRGARDSGAGPLPFGKGKEAAPLPNHPELLRDQAAAHEACLRLLDQLIQVKPLNL